MNTIVRLAFGSHLYGTETPQSDLDFKSVFIPDACDILLQRAPKSLGAKRPKAEGEKNFAGEIDEESFALHHYLHLLAEGQLIALDMLFASRDAMRQEPSWIWQEIQRNKARLISRKTKSFLGYCRKQANKYGIKGSQVAAASDALALLTTAEKLYGTTAKLRECESEIKALTDNYDAMQILDIAGPMNAYGVSKVVRHWEVCNRKMPFTQTIKSAHEIVNRVVEEYGHRARQAQDNQGVDWKALSHAVRVGRESIELLLSGQIRFPRPDREHLRAIKLGQYPYILVAEEIEKLLEDVEVAAQKSVLPEEVDLAWIDQFVAGIYAAVIRGDSQTIWQSS